ncbi:MAG: hypothetical protein HYY01_07550 [Chloroflexi bacterium]|nr:hypothetical protein [Chloroflexota bacterium]
MHRGAPTLYANLRGVMAMRARAGPDARSIALIDCCPPACYCGAQGGEMSDSIEIVVYSDYL